MLQEKPPTNELGDAIIFSLGGSLIVPDHVDAEYLQKFREIILRYLPNYRQFVIVSGGGKTARRYQEAAKIVNNPSEDDLDWLGIHSSRLNGHLLRTIFKQYADPEMLTSPDKMTPRTAKILIGAGYRPGNSTDYVATLFAQAYGIKSVVNLSNIDYVYDSDPRQNPQAKALKEISWGDFQGLVGEKWIPGANAPFDPIATKSARKLGLQVIVMNGHRFDQLEALLEGREFEGTLIH